VLTKLVPRLPMEQQSQAWEHALEAALAIQNKEICMRTLISFLPLKIDQERLLRNIRLLSIEVMKELKHSVREGVFDFLVEEENLLKPVILSYEILSSITSSIIEICNKWQWL